MNEHIKSWTLVFIGLAVIALGFIEGSGLVILPALFVGGFLILAGAFGSRMEGRQLVGRNGVEINLVRLIGDKALEQNPDLEPQQLLDVVTNTLPNVESGGSEEMISREVAYSLDAVLSDRVDMSDNVEVEHRGDER